MKRLWHDGAIADYYDRGYWSSHTIYERFLERANEHPDKEALVDRHRRVTYGALRDEVERCAAVLRRHGVQAGDVVTVQVPNQIEFATVMLALELVGAIANNVSTDYRSNELEYILNFSKSAVHVCAASFRGHDFLRMMAKLRGWVPSLRLIVSVGGEELIAESTSDDVVNALDDVVFLKQELKAVAPLSPAEWTRPHPDDVMRLAFTSGTTGDPKGVMHSHNTTLFPVLTMNRGMQIDARSTQMIFMPVTLNTGYLGLLQTLVAGARGVLVDHFSVEDALGTIERERISAFSTPPAALVMMLEAPDLDRYDLSSLRVIKSGGAPASLELLRQIQHKLSARLVESYGMLETGFHCHTRVEDDPLDGVGTVGRPVEGMRLSIRSAEGREVAAGEEGELYAAGPGVHLGYIDNAAANEASFTTNGWFYTGDLGRLDANGRLVISGRKKEIINRAGKKYFPREIEEILLTHPKILDVAIVGLPDSRTGEKNCACVIPRDGTALTLGEIVRFLEDRVARYKLPEQLVIRASFPRTSTGKVKRPVLVEEIMVDGAQS
ncbi:class I adenylate-forming enzyme family protein [Paraburkholderia sp. J12]|uniref:class I adenylate-forming enzyme family protein n=1 Tax=Paraburkholderia sp. J12 TaxID=2805432 RepID=UPI002ABE788F|nr:AMP-binding protein [Paraburkholderia sp. J12]